MLVFADDANSEGGMDKDDVSRYMAIVSRQPFGASDNRAESNDSNTSAAKQDSPFKDWRLCFIAENENGEVTAGIVNGRSKASHYLKVGESIDGIELISADYKTETAVLRSGDDQQVLHMTDSGNTSSARPVSNDRSSRQDSFRQSSDDQGSYIRRIRPRERRLPTRENSDTNDNVLLEKHLQEYQMEVIRAKGELGPPLPIQLTKEMDDQLVAEGVLPAVEKE